ncbi:MAG: hypothetical protein SFV22_02700 [Saprospiraceae bacterium]|nr:hypothetical protein [Saprospiraceae bacterium]
MKKTPNTESNSKLDYKTLSQFFLSICIAFFSAIIAIGLAYYRLTAEKQIPKEINTFETTQQPFDLAKEYNHPAAPSHYNDPDHRFVIVILAPVEEKEKSASPAVPATKQENFASQDLLLPVVNPAVTGGCLEPQRTQEESSQKSIDNEASSAHPQDDLPVDQATEAEMFFELNRGDN